MSEGYMNAIASSSSSLNGSFQNTADDQTIASILAEENLHNDGKLAKGLSHLDSILHTPCVNGEIPDVNDATLDHERLSESSATYGLAELQIEGDGNCQFRALADQLFRNPDYHKHVRRQIVKQLKHSKKLYEGYLKRMKRSGEWGDHVTLQAAADRFGAKICLVTSFRDMCYIEIMSKQFGAKICLVTSFHDVLHRDHVQTKVWLSFWSEVHYNSLYASGEVPIRIPRRKHWLF